MLNQYLGYGFIAVAFVVLLYKDNLLKLLVKQPAQPKVAEDVPSDPIKVVNVQVGPTPGTFVGSVTTPIEASKPIRSELFQSLDFLRSEFRAQGNEEGFSAINEAGKALFQDDLNEKK